MKSMYAVIEPYRGNGSEATQKCCQGSVLPYKYFLIIFLFLVRKGFKVLSKLPACVVMAQHLNRVNVV